MFEQSRSYGRVVAEVPFFFFLGSTLRSSPDFQARFEPLTERVCGESSRVWSPCSTLHPWCFWFPGLCPRNLLPLSFLCFHQGFLLARIWIPATTSRRTHIQPGSEVVKFGNRRKKNRRKKKERKKERQKHVPATCTDRFPPRWTLLSERLRLLPEAKERERVKKKFHSFHKLLFVIFFSTECRTRADFTPTWRSLSAIVRLFVGVFLGEWVGRKQRRSPWGNSAWEFVKLRPSSFTPERHRRRQSVSPSTLFYISFILFIFLEKWRRCCGWV